MKILKSSFHFQPSDDLFPIDKFRQITEFIKITANLKRRFVMVTTPDILTALSLVMRLEPIGNLLWQGRIENNQFELIPDIFHPMNKPGYILIRYVDADTVTLIEFEEHVMGVAGFDSIVGKTEETETETETETKQKTKYESDDQFKERFYGDLPPVDEQQKDPRYFQVAERVGDKYVFDPEICIPSTETCGERIHDVCCEKAKMAKADAVRKAAQMDARPSDDIPVWKSPIEKIEKLLYNYQIAYKREDSDSCHYLRYENGYKEYYVCFEETNTLAIPYRAVLTNASEGEVLWQGLIDSYNKLHELEHAIVCRIKPMENEEC